MASDLSTSSRSLIANSDGKIPVTFFQRKPRDGANFSLEFVFSDVRSRLRDSIDACVHIAPCLSNGVLPRLRILLDAYRNQQGIAHVTGDINYVAIALESNYTILTVLDCGFMARTRGLKQLLLRTAWLNLPVRRSSIVTTISQSARREILDITRCHPSKVRVIPVAVSTRFTYQQKEFCTDRPRVLQLGTAPNKNVIRLAQALEGLRCTLVIIGQIPDDATRQLAASKIEYENYYDLTLDEVVRQYQAADIVSFPSTYEGFGMPILEGNATGRPVLTSSLSSMPEVAEDAACLVDPFDVASIRAGIQKICRDTDYRHELIQNGLRNVQRFHPQWIAEKYLALYREVYERAAK